MLQAFPAGLTIAVVAIIGALIAGLDPWLGGTLLLAWLGTLWLLRPETQAQTAPRREDAFARETVVGMIEPLGVPVMLLRDGRIVLANALARARLGAHILGQDARIALRHPDAIALLNRAEEGEASGTIANFLGARSLWQTTVRRIDQRHTMIELLDRTAEADISRAHTDFVANASHELRTPLASIIGYVETLEEQEPPTGRNGQPNTRLRFLGIVLREARRLQALVEELMALSRIEAEKHEPPRTTVDLSMIVRTAANDLSTLSGDNRIHVEVTPGLKIAGDARQIDQLVRNLADNAMKYGDPTQPVTVTLSPGARPGCARLTVIDRGEGIAAEHLPYLTRRFYRTDPGRSRQAGGTGLGLAIVKHIVERHRGRLDIASTVGKGTTVTVDLPLATAD